jgi:hypothetical protein
MEFFGIISFGLICSVLSKVDKISYLEQRLKKIERKEKGDLKMSRMFQDLVGKECKIILENGTGAITIGEVGLLCNILEVDDDWIKIQYKTKKNEIKTSLLKICNIEEVEIL